MSSTLRSRKTGGGKGAAPPSSSSSSSSSSKAKGAANDVKKTVFLYCCVALVPFALYCCWTIPATMRKRQQERPAYSYPQLSDVWMTVASLAVFIPARILMSKYVFMPLGDFLIPGLDDPKRKWTPKARQNRVERFGAVGFKFMYFVIISVAGFAIMRPTNWFPAELGGTGDALNIWEGFPFPPNTPYLREYYLIELGYHVQSLLFHVFESSRNDYLEMMLHHSCAVFLVLFSYYLNFVRVGALVFFVHDVADVVSYLVKASVDTTYTKVTLTIYFSLLAVWGYTRFFCFPFVIIANISEGRSIVEAASPEHYQPYDWNYLVGMLYVLLFLHFYWYSLFLYMGYSYMATGVTQDLQQKSGAEIEVARLLKEKQERMRRSAETASSGGGD